MKDGRGGVEGCSNVGSCCIAPTSPGVSRLPRKKVAAGAEELIWQPGSSMATPPGQLDYLHSLKTMPALLGVSCFRQQPVFLKRIIFHLTNDEIVNWGSHRQRSSKLVWD